MNGIIIHPHEISDYWIHRLREAKDAGAKLDTIAMHPVGGKDAAASLEAMLRQVKTREFARFAEQIEGLGMQLEYEMHTLSWLLPRSEFASHPEYFRMNDAGERTPDANFCPSNEDALAYIEERAARLATLVPQAGHRYFYWLDDIRGTYCHCPKCRELTASDQAMLIVNRILRGIRRIDPMAKLCYLAYIDSIAPPKSIAPSKGVFLEYAPIDRDYARPIADPDCEKNVREAKHLIPLLDFFGRDDSQILDYWIDNSLYCNWRLPYKKLIFHADVMAADVAYYRSLGFASITSFGCFLGEDYAREFGNPPITEYAQILKG